MNRNTTIAKEVDSLYRENFGKMVASLAHFFGLHNLEMVEDVVQDTFVSAYDSWQQNGLPNDPLAWLFKVCKNKALNELNKGYHKFNTPYLYESLYERETINIGYKLDTVFLKDEIKDNQLHLLFATCHPVLSQKSQIILSLKCIVGFKITEIAKALGMSEEGVKKNLVRTRRTLREGTIKMTLPYIRQSKERLKQVQLVLYLMFSEGYKASSGKNLIRKELCLEAMKLTKSLINVEDISTPDTKALFALMCFNAARFEARIGSRGEIIELESQNRMLWDQDLIALGIEYFNSSKPREYTSNYHLEAGIASIHCKTPEFKNTKWDVILKLYNELITISHSPYAYLNRCIALFYVSGARQALDELKKSSLPTLLREDHLYNVTLGTLYWHIGENEKAINHYLEALQHTNLAIEKDYIINKIESISS